MFRSPAYNPKVKQTKMKNKLTSSVNNEKKKPQYQHQLQQKAKSKP